MFAYIARRVLATIPLLIVALYIVHVMVSTTANPLANFVTCLPRCQEGRDRIIDVYNLDVNVWVRPFLWFRDAIQGDFGTSDSIGLPVTEVLLERGKNTAMIAVPAFIIGSLVALVLSMYSARRPYSVGDYTFTGASFVAFAFPTFVLGLILQHVMAVRFPEWTGWKPFNTGRKSLDGPVGLLRDITLPALTLVIVGIAADSRFGRASMLETLSQDYIRTARAKGLPERTVAWKHGLRNALIPLVTLWALNFSALLSGSVVTESIFSWPGLGPAFLTALGDSDLELLLGIVIFSAILAVVFNLIADVLYGVLDPRIRFD